MKPNKNSHFSWHVKSPYENKNSNRPKGKILRIKHGYNPNSSSMGSIIFALPVALLGISIGFGAVSSIIAAAFMKDTEIKNTIQNQTPPVLPTDRGHTENKGE